MKKTIFLALFSTITGLMAATPPTPPAPPVDCLAVSHVVKHAVKADKSKVLEIVSNKIGESPACVCEIVKSAIEASKANPSEVASIVQTAVNSAPDQMLLIVQCALAVAPDAREAVEALFPNVLNFPGGNPPTKDGMPIIPRLPPVIIAPPDVSDVDP